MRFRYYLFIAMLVTYQLVCSASPASPQKLTVVLDWFPNPNHAPIYVAQTKGYFKEKGLEVVIITPADPTDPPKWVAMGRADIAIDYQPHVLIERARGLPIRQIGTLINQPLDSLVVLTANHVHKLGDLRGQRIAYSSPEIDLPILKTMLAHDSLRLRDVVPINVHYNLMQALLSGKVAAAIGMSRNIELLQLQALHCPVKAYYPEDYGVPKYSELVFIAKVQSGEDNRYARFFSALDQARNDLVAQPQKSLQEVISASPELAHSFSPTSWQATVRLFAPHSGVIDVDHSQKLSEYLSKTLSITP